MDEIQAMREKITVIGRMLFDRQLTDAAGGNISARVGERVCITPRFAGQKHQWQPAPGTGAGVRPGGKLLYGEGDISREAKVHFRLYHDFPDGTAVMHCHPRNVLVFCANDQPILPVIEATWKFGEIKVVPFAPAHSQALADYVAGAIQGQEARIRKQAAAVMGRWHGLFVLGRDLDAAFDAAERIDTNARIILMGGGAAGRPAAGARALRGAGQRPGRAGPLSMIVTVTLNTGLDHTLFMDKLRLGYTQKVRASTISMAGKPADASWVLSTLGIPNLATGFAAGELGKKMEAMLRARGAQTDFLWVARRDAPQHRDHRGWRQPADHPDHRDPADHPARYRRLSRKAGRAAGGAGAMIIGGSAPRQGGPRGLPRPGGAGHGARACRWCWMPAAPTWPTGWRAIPAVIKPNQQELEAFVGRALPGKEDVLAAARALRERCDVAVIATLGKDGAFAVLPGRDYFIPPLDVPVVSAAGAGDATVAGLAKALANGQPLEEGVRLGLAAAAAVLMQPGTADCKKEDVERLLGEVQLIPILKIYHRDTETQRLYNVNSE